MSPLASPPATSSRGPREKWRGCMRGLRALLLVSGLLVAPATASEEASESSEPAEEVHWAKQLKILSASRAERRVLIGDELHEYIEIDVRFSAPVYALACEKADAVHVAEAARCASCPDGCVLSAIFSRYPYIPDLLPKLESNAECICGSSYEEMQLRVQGWPGDQGFNVLTDRRPAFIHGLPTKREAYGNAIWKFDALMAELECPNEANMTPALARIRRFGLNGPPLDESLLWLRRFETSFGVEKVERLLANASRSYDVRRAVFQLPVRRTKNGRTRVTGLTFQQLQGCKLGFPYLVGPLGQPTETIPDITKLAVRKFQCKKNEIDSVHRQMKAVLQNVLTAGRQTGQCTSDWRTTFPPRGVGGPGGTSGVNFAFGHQDPTAAVNSTYSPYTQEKDDRRLKKTGVLSLKKDFEEPVNDPQKATVACYILRWQLRLRAQNTRERAVAYSAMDAINGCWALMEKALKFETRTVTVESQSCKWDPEQPEFNADPCCNRQKLRWQCCMKRNNTMEKPMPVGVDKAAMSESCRFDTTGGAEFFKAAMAASMTWQRRLTEASGNQKSWTNLAVEEQANAAMWRAIEQCHADVMGRFDRELAMFVGSPCLVDSDCLTTCRRPALKSQQTRVSPRGLHSKHKPLVVGRCSVPTTQSHVYIVKCLVRRLGKEVVELFAAELDINVRQRNEEKITEMLAAVGGRMTHICVGPYWRPGVRGNETACYQHKGCNWNQEIKTQLECEAEQLANQQFCGCREGWCPQQSRRQGCIAGKIFTNHCNEARELLKPVEMACSIIASTAPQLDRCRALKDTHNTMMRRCHNESCLPIVSYFYADEQCNDRAKIEFGGCYDKCIMPSGPNPSLERKACFFELWDNETDKDCFSKPGDTRVHYSPPAGGEDIEENWASALHVGMPRHRRPRWCEIKVWQELQQSYKPRSINSEHQRFWYDEKIARDTRAKEDRRTQGLQEQEKIYARLNPPKFIGCDLGGLELTAENSGACRGKQQDTCCLSPENSTTGFCKVCVEANTTACAEGERVFAVWAPNLRAYPATLAEDLGSDLARVTWDDGDKFYRQVPWPWLWSTKGPGCHPAKQGCANHNQCPDGQYCFGCEACADAHGGNPPAGLCDPCPTHRGGGCGAIASCTRLQDGVDGTCPTMEAVNCPCLDEWSVREQYPGAPKEQSINSCFFDATSNSRWCEVDQKYYGGQCGVQRIVGKDRFIYWQKCLPQNCNMCNCDCSKKCKAYDVIPLEGRLPPFLTPGELNASLDNQFRHFSGVIAPNCTQGSSARIRDQCPFCVECCADFCNAKAEAEGGFDCTTTQISGCSDSLRGWVDAVGRSCLNYAMDNLCTPGGLFGTNWVYNPPRSFQDFAASQLAAVDVCCDCGGGVDCSDVPYDWTDPDGHDCNMYETNKWCNRSGYGPNWNYDWGPFQLGKDGVDARTACCFCGGGKGLALPQVQNHIITLTDSATCQSVWPGRSRYEYPVWIQKSIHLCQRISNVCMKKVTANAYEESLGYSIPDDPRIFGICQQIGYDTGTLPYLEDHEIDNTPGGRRLSAKNSSAPEARQLAELDRNQDMIPKELTKTLYSRGAGVTVDFFNNAGSGLCYYRMPDPTELFGGPNRKTMPPPLLPERVAPTDVYSAPTLQALGWPNYFAAALFEDSPGEEELALSRIAHSTSTEVASHALRGILANQGIELVLQGTFEARLESWMQSVEDVYCEGAVDEELVEFRQDLRWSPAHLNDERTCETERCDVDEMIYDDWTCKLTYGCSTTCAYCMSPALVTQEQGLCISEAPGDLAICESELGGMLIQDMVFDERKGVRQYVEACAMPHRPIIDCQYPGQRIKRCANFDEEHCEGDPLGDLMGCQLSLRTCLTREECELSGYCSDVNIGLSYATGGTCVVTPLDDDLIQQGCRTDGLCFFRVDPAFGMEVRHRHGMLDLSFEGNEDYQDGSTLENAAADANSLLEARLAEEAESMTEIQVRLRSGGRLNQTECEKLDLGPPFEALWIEKANTPSACQRWEACCLLTRGDKCELFTAQVVDAHRHPELAKQRQMECRLCGGTWEKVFSWTSGEWRRGSLKSPERRWYEREWGSMNEWAAVVDIDIMRQLYENALETRIGRQRVNAALGLLEPLMSSLSIVAAACGSEAQQVDTQVWKLEEGEHGKAAPSAQVQLPSAIARLGSTMATSGLVSSGSVGDVTVKWHEFSTQKYGAADVEHVDYEVQIEPFEYHLAVASPVHSLPGRLNQVRSLLSGFMVAEDTTTTIGPAEFETLDANGIRGGYPAWFVNEMVNLGIDVEAQEAEANAILAAGAEARRQERLRAQAELAKKADASSELPEASIAVLLELIGMNNTKEVVDSSAFPDRGAPEQKDDGTMHLDSFTCRSIVPNKHGEVIGLIIGDCVRLHSTQPLENAVEICVPLTYASDEDLRILNSTPQVQSLGYRLDFARKTQVPDVYTTEAPSAPEAGLQVPGYLGQTVFAFEENPTYGRLPSGWSVFEPLNLEAELRDDGVGSRRLCSKIFDEEETYCPIAVLNISDTDKIWKNESGLPKIFGFDTTCESLDVALAAVHDAQVESSQVSSQKPEAKNYVPRDQQVSDVDLLAWRARGIQKVQGTSSADLLPICLPGNCLVSRGRGFQVVEEGAANGQCTILC